MVFLKMNIHHKKQQIGIFHKSLKVNPHKLYIIFSRAARGRDPVPQIPPAPFLKKKSRTHIFENPASQIE